MRFSIYLWIPCIVLDFLLKSAFSYLLSAVTLGGATIWLFLYIAVIWAVIHYTCLFLANALTAALNVSRVARFWLTLLATNVFFVIIVTLMSIGDLSHFSGFVQLLLPMVLINLLPILICGAIGYVANDIRHSMRTNRANVGD